MLIQMLQTFTTSPQHLADLAEEVITYEQRIVSNGYIGRRKRSSLVDPVHHRVQLTGILQSRTALDDLAACEDPLLASLRKKVAVLCTTPPTVETFEAAAGRDEIYCEHSRWKEVVLICDPIQGLSPIRCNECGGIIARYRLTIDDDTADLIWRWERQYDRIHMLWVQAAEYEEWAEHELASLNSPINTMGQEIARQLTAQLGLQAYHYLHLKEEGLDRQCPDCGQRMHEAIGTIWNLGCRDCCLVVGRG